MALYTEISLTLIDLECKDSHIMTIMLLLLADVKESRPRPQCSGAPRRPNSLGGMANCPVGRSQLSYASEQNVTLCWRFQCCLTDMGRRRSSLRHVEYSMRKRCFQCQPDSGLEDRVAMCVRLAHRSQQYTVSAALSQKEKDTSSTANDSAASGLGLHCVVIFVESAEDAEWLRLISDLLSGWSKKHRGPSKAGPVHHHSS